MTRKMFGKESAIGVVLVRQMKALKDAYAPRKLITVSTPVMASSRAVSSVRDPSTTRTAGFDSVSVGSFDRNRT